MTQVKESKSIENPVVLITGGSGFLGKAIVDELLLPSSSIKAKEIRVLDVKPFKGENENNITFIQGDIRDYERLHEASKGVDLMIHSAAIIDWGTKDEKEVLDINFGGTENALRASRENGIRSFIYTSSLDAVYTGKPLVDVDESLDYPPRHVNSYCKSKRLSEERVMQANGSDLNTCILRPSDIYGEEDPYHIDSLIEMAKNGFYIRLGNGKSKCQHVYVRNMAHAHLLAGAALLQEDKKVSGNIYFITDGEACNFFTFFDRIVLEAGYKIWPRNLWLGKWIAYPIASITEFGALVISPIKKFNVKFSRFAVDYTCTDFTFTSEKAQRDFNYYPKYGLEEAIERTSTHYRKAKN
jgi:nucleoside-diphosphate-sugar epimerase